MIDNRLAVVSLIGMRRQSRFMKTQARHSLNNKLLKYGVKGHLLTAGMCHLCKADVVSITNALEKYQVLLLPQQTALTSASWRGPLSNYDMCSNLYFLAGSGSDFFRNTGMQVLSGKV